MVTLLLDSTRLEVALTAVERALAFRKQNVQIERDSIARVQLTDDPWTWLRGASARGTYVRGLTAMGTWRSSTGEDFVLVRRRRPGVVIDLEGADYERVILTTRHGLALVQALRLDVEDVPADVVSLATGALSTIDDPAETTRD